MTKNFPSLAVFRSMAYVLFVFVCLQLKGQLAIPIQPVTLDQAHQGSLDQRNNNGHTTVFQHGGRVWVQIDDALFFSTGNRLNAVQEPTCYLLDGGKKTWQPQPDHLSVSSVVMIGDEMYVGSDRGLFEASNGAIKPIFSEQPCEPSYVRKQRDRPDPFQAGTSNDSYRKGVTKLAQIGDYLWFQATDYGIGRIESGHAQILTNTNSFSTILGTIGNYVYLNTNLTDRDGVYVVNNSLKGLSDSPVLFTGAAESLSHRRIAEGGAVNNHFWLIATDGLFLVQGTSATFVTHLPDGVVQTNGDFSVTSSILSEVVGTSFGSSPRCTTRPRQRFIGRNGGRPIPSHPPK